MKYLRGVIKKVLDFIDFFGFLKFSPIIIIDILIVALVLYKIMLLIKGTRAVQLIKGIMILVVATTITSWFNLKTINWLLQQVMTMLMVALPIVFQPELRRALEKLGRGKFFSRSIISLKDEEKSQVINEITRAVQVLSKNNLGALIVIERSTGLEEYVNTGVKIEGSVSSELIINIFIPKTPLHDGACIIRGDRIAAAACFLPLSDSEVVQELGSRHRAGVGITEYSDALSVIVSEETGSISLACEGMLYKSLDEIGLKNHLKEKLTYKSTTFLMSILKKSGVDK